MKQKPDRRNRQIQNHSKRFQYSNSISDRISRDIKSKDREDLTFINQLDVIDVYRTFHLTIAEYSFQGYMSNL